MLSLSTDYEFVTDKWMHGWMHRWMDRWTHTVDGCMNKYCFIILLTNSLGCCTFRAHDVELKSSSVLPCHRHWYTPVSLSLRLVRYSVFVSKLSGWPLWYHCKLILVPVAIQVKLIDSSTNLWNKTELLRASNGIWWTVSGSIKEQY